LLGNPGKQIVATAKKRAYDLAICAALGVDVIPATDIKGLTVRFIVPKGCVGPSV